MIGCLRTRVRKQPIIALYFESENELKLYNLEARKRHYKGNGISGRGRYIFCSSVMLGTACTALFEQTLICLILRRGKLTL